MCRFEVDTVEAVNNPDEYGVCLFYFNELIRASLESDYIVLQWSLPTRNQHRVEFYEIFYNSTGNPVPQKHFVVRTRDNTVRIHNLDPETEYELYVKKAEITGAQIAGIILAVVAVIAIGVVIFLIISKSRIQKQKMSESVSFENPGYGNQQVHIGGLPGEAPYDNVMQPQNQPREDGTFGYARLNEDQAAATAAAASSKAVSEMEYPSDKYVYDTPAGVKPDTNGTSQDVATLPVSDITPHTNNESTT
nr:hypothetical protein BaRGS_002175 [Batillaria attramentaria]